MKSQLTMIKKAFNNFVKKEASVEERQDFFGEEEGDLTTIITKFLAAHRELSEAYNSLTLDELCKLEEYAFSLFDWILDHWKED